MGNPTGKEAPGALHHERQRLLRPSRHLRRARSGFRSTRPHLYDLYNGGQSPGGAMPRPHAGDSLARPGGMKAYYVSIRACLLTDVWTDWLPFQSDCRNSIVPSPEMLSAAAWARTPPDIGSHGEGDRLWERADMKSSSP